MEGTEKCSELAVLCTHVIATKYSKAALHVVYADSIYTSRLQELENAKVIEDKVQAQNEISFGSWYSTPLRENNRVLFPILDTEH